MGLFDKFFSLFKKKKDKEPPTDEKEKNKPEETEEILETIPKSEAEAQSIRKIVNMFRFYMSPSFEGAANTSRVFVVPATFDITYIMSNGTPNGFLNKISS